MARKDMGYSIAEAADTLKVSRQYIYQLITSNGLHPSTRTVDQKFLTQQQFDALRERMGR